MDNDAKCICCLIIHMNYVQLIVSFISPIFNKCPVCLMIRDYINFDNYLNKITKTLPFLTFKSPKFCSVEVKGEDVISVPRTVTAKWRKRKMLKIFWRPGVQILPASLIIINDDWLYRMKIANLLLSSIKTCLDQCLTALQQTSFVLTKRPILMMSQCLPMVFECKVVCFFVGENRYVHPLTFLDMRNPMQNLLLDSARN